MSVSVSSKWPGILMAVCPGDTGSSAFGVFLDDRSTVSDRVGTVNRCTSLNVP
jgi:hypothetical protein